MLGSVCDLPRSAHELLRSVRKELGVVRHVQDSEHNSGEYIPGEPGKAKRSCFLSLPRAEKLLSVLEVRDKVFG